MPQLCIPCIFIFILYHTIPHTLLMVSKNRARLCAPYMYLPPTRFLGSRFRGISLKNCPVSGSVSGKRCGCLRFIAVVWGSGRARESRRIVVFLDGKRLVPWAGFEPTQLVQPGDFKSPGTSSPSPNKYSGLGSRGESDTQIIDRFQGKRRHND